VRGRFSSVTLWVAALCGGAGSSAFVSGGSEPPELIFLSVGQGDCTVIRRSDFTILIDAGPRTDSYDAGPFIASKLRKLGIHRVDLVILTHPDSDHIGGLAGLAGLVPVRHVAVPGYFRDRPDLADSFSRAGIGGESLMWLASDSQLKLEGGLEMVIRLPKFESGMPDNDGSPFIRVGAGGHTAVLTGDASSEAEMQIEAREVWDCDVLKAGHHGSKSSTCESWLAETSPRFVIVSCGRNNSYGHPAPEVLERARRSGADVLRTDELGDIRFRWSSSGLERVR